MKFLDLPEYGIIDAHMHPYLANDRDFGLDIPVNYDEKGIDRTVSLRYDAAVVRQIQSGAASALPRHL